MIIMKKHFFYHLLNVFLLLKGFQTN